jgi:colanic acid biosynthesis glycosyl transferase WcaI
VYVIVSPPLLLGVAAWFVGKIKDAPFVFHVQDMQPDAAVGLGMLKGSRLTRALYALESFAYRQAARVSGITRGMLKSFRSKGVPEWKLVYFPNAIELSNAELPPERGEFRRRYGFAAEEFLAIYAGNLGVKQGLDVLLETAPLLGNPRIRIVICGDGPQRESLTQRVHELKLPNVSMLPLQVGRDYRALLVDADVCFITQQAGAGNSFFPSKLLGLLAASKPVVTVAAPECELAIALREGNFGVNVPPDQPRELAAVLGALAKDRPRLAEFGEAGRRYVEQFEKTRVFEKFLGELAGVV